MKMTKTNQVSISKKLVDNQAYMEKYIGAGVSYDIDFRELVILKRNIQLYYLNGLTDDISVVQLIKTLVEINDNESNKSKAYEVIKNRLINLSVEEVQTMDESVDQLLSGLVVVFIDGEKTAFVVDVRSYPGRSPEEPDTERVIRGSRDGFTENIIENTALMRRRVRDARLRHEMLKVGERSKTDVCICYIKDITDEGLIKLTKEHIEAIEIDAITMADKAVEEFITKYQWNPYPLVRYTERPDVAANHLLEGHIILMVDTSPSVIILPTTMFDHLEHAEEYRQTPAVGTFIRWIRFLGVLASLYLLPFWLLFVMEPTLLPKELAFIGPNEEGNIPILLQIVLGYIGVEFLRMAAIHTPNALATSLGLIAAVLVGQIAIDVGMLSPEVVLYVAISTIGSYVTPSYELGVANKMLSFSLLLVTGIFGLKGFTIGFAISILLLASLKSLKTPYLWPFIPFNIEGMFHFLLRVPVPFSKRRKTIVHPRNLYNQPTNKN